MNTKFFTKYTRHSRLRVLNLIEPRGFFVSLVVKSKIYWLTENAEEHRRFKYEFAEGAEVAAQCFGSQKTRKGSEDLITEYIKTSILATLNFVSIFIIS